MKHGSLNPYQAIQAFVATLNPKLRPFLIDNDVMLRHMIQGYLDGMVELGRITRYDAASAALNARWMANAVMEEDDSDEATPY